MSAANVGLRVLFGIARDGDLEIADPLQAGDELGALA